MNMFEGSNEGLTNPTYCVINPEIPGPFLLTGKSKFGIFRLL